MTSRKHIVRTTFDMPLTSKLERKLQAADDSSDGEDYYEVTDRSSSESFIDGGDGGDVISSGDEEGDFGEQELVFLRVTTSEETLLMHDSPTRKTMKTNKPRLKSAKSPSALWLKHKMRSQRISLQIVNENAATILQNHRRTNSRL